MARMTSFPAMPFSSHQLNFVFPFHDLSSCTVDIGDDTMWLKLFYWPFDLKMDLLKAMAAECCKTCRCSWRQRYSDCILYSIASMERSLLCRFWLHRCSCQTHCWNVFEAFTGFLLGILSIANLASRPGLVCFVQAWGPVTMCHVDCDYQPSTY